MKNRKPKIETQNRKTYDVIIIGGGAAGMSAALWCDDLGLSALLLERSGELGGQLLWTYNPIENHLGIKTKNGREMRDIFVKQIETREFDLLAGAENSEIDLKNKRVLLAGGQSVSAQFLIIATGVRRRTLGIKGEERFQNKGILLSGKRDQDLVKNKKAVIVGGGDAAIENALILAEAASQVAVIHRRDKFRARDEFLQKALDNPKISLLTETAVTKISGGETVESIEIKNIKTNEISTLATDAVLLRIGVVPNTENFADSLQLDENGYIKINAEGETNIKQVYAVGDVANPVSPTVSTAVGTGAAAVKSIYLAKH